MTLQGTKSASIALLVSSLGIGVVFSLQILRSRRSLHTHTALPPRSAYEKLIGSTPMVKLDYLSTLVGRCIYLKMESMNPGGTGKDRAALCMIQHAEISGQLPRPTTSESNRVKQLHDVVYDLNIVQEIDSQTAASACGEASRNDVSSLTSLQQSIDMAMTLSRTGGLVIEGTSGSTGISLASLCMARGHACIVVLPDDQAPEKKCILQALGATVRIVPTASISNPNHYVNVAKKLAEMAHDQGIAAVFINQFENLANFKVHYECTGPEIYNGCPQMDAFCMSSGTGGTISGVAKYLKERKPSVRVVLVDPPGSALYCAIQYGVAYAPQQRERTLKRHRYDTIAEGIGLDRLTSNFKLGMEYIDEAVQVSDQEALDMAHYLLQNEGLWVGSSSAMNVVGAVRAALALPRGSTVVTVICDAGQRHVARFWNKNFVSDWGLIWPKDSEVCVPECLKEIMS